MDKRVTTTIAPYVNDFTLAIGKPARQMVARRMYFDLFHNKEETYVETRSLIKNLKIIITTDTDSQTILGNRML